MAFVIGCALLSLAYRSCSAPAIVSGVSVCSEPCFHAASGEICPLVRRLAAGANFPSERCLCCQAAEPVFTESSVNRACALTLPDKGHLRLTYHAAGTDSACLKKSASCHNRVRTDTENFRHAADSRNRHRTCQQTERRKITRSRIRVWTTSPSQ